MTKEELYKEANDNDFYIVIYNIDFRRQDSCLYAGRSSLITAFHKYTDATLKLVTKGDIHIQGEKSGYIYNEARDYHIGKLTYHLRENGEWKSENTFAVESNFPVDDDYFDDYNDLDCAVDEFICGMQHYTENIEKYAKDFDRDKILSQKESEQTVKESKQIVEKDDGDTYYKSWRDVPPIPKQKEVKVTQHTTTTDSRIHDIVTGDGGTSSGSSHSGYIGRSYWSANDTTLSVSDWSNSKYMRRKIYRYSKPKE